MFQLQNLFATRNSVQTQFITNDDEEETVTKFKPNSKPRLMMKIAKFKPNPIPQLTRKKSLGQLLAGKEGRQWNGQYRLLLCHFDIVVG